MRKLTKGVYDEPKPRVCPGCRERFDTLTPTRKYCSTPCRRRHEKVRGHERGDAWYLRDVAKRKADGLARRQDARRYMSDIKLASGCVDCGYRAHPAALHFDHVDPAQKVRQVSGCSTRNMVDAEASKCVVRCANCHAVRTATERHWLVRRPA